MEYPQAQRFKMHRPLTFVHGLQADLLTSQCLTDVNALTLRFNLPTGSDTPFLPVLRVAPLLRQPFRIGARRWDVDAGRRLLAQGFVRSFFIVFVLETIKALLLFLQ